MNSQNDLITGKAGSEEPWVIIAAGDRLYAVQSVLVRTMIMLPPVTVIPNTPNYVRGVINLSGENKRQTSPAERSLYLGSSIGGVQIALCVAPALAAEDFAHSAIELLVVPLS